MKTRQLIGIAGVIAIAVAIYLAIAAIVGEPPRRTAPAAVPTALPAQPAQPAASPLPAAPAAVAAPEPPPSVADDAMRALQGKEPRRKAAPVPVRKPPGNYEVHTIDGFSLVHLGPGALTTKPFGGPSDERTRTITGRVIDRGGKPVANAIVLANPGFHISRNDVMAIGSAISDGAGAFSVPAPVGKAYALALVREDWSEIVRVEDPPIELRMLGHGSLAGRFTYDGAVETFSVNAEMQGAPFAAKWQTGKDGTITIPSLPPGRYTISVALAGGLGNRALSRDVTIVDGKTAELELALTAGTTVVVAAKPPAGSEPKGITYWLFTASAPRDGAEARARKQAENTRSHTLGGSAKGSPAEFNDVVPGTYYACAGFFDIATMDALDRPFGCTKIAVAEADSVREVEIVLAN